MRLGEARNERDLLDALIAAVGRRTDRRRGFESNWWENVALVAGDHSARWNPTQSTFEDRDSFFKDLEGKKPKLVINHALTVFRTELAKMTKSRPIMDIIANSDEETDMAATKVGRGILEALEWKFNLRHLRKEALSWTLKCGVSAVYVGWDYLNDEAGYHEFLIDPNTGEPTFNEARKDELRKQEEAGEIKLEIEQYPLGEIDFCVYSPFQLLPDETALSWNKIRDLITVEAVDIDTVRGIYSGAKDVGNLQPEESQLGVMETRMMSRAGIPAMQEKAQNTVKVYTWWLLPNTYRGNNYLKDGKMIRWAGNRVVLDDSKAFPYQDGRMPFAFFEHIPSDATIWPDSIQSHIRGPNLEIDKTVSQLIENKDFMANPMWRVATQHKIKGKIKNVAGGIVRYVHRPNVPPPEPVQGLQMPQQVENLLVGLREQILDISGQSEVARGRVPTGVRSGVQVAYLQEEDDTKLGPSVENFEDAVALMGSLALERVSQYYERKRILRYYRRDGQFDVIKFKGADLKNNTDVVCQAGSAMPKMKAAKQQYALQLAEMGIIKDPKQLKEMLDLGVGEPDLIDKAMAQANRENNVMIHGLDLHMFDTKEPEQQGATLPEGQGPPGVDGQQSQPMSAEDQTVQKVIAAVPVKKWHLHEVHLERHYSEMMSDEFDKLAISHPEIVRIMDEHTSLHEQAIQEKLQQQMAMAEAIKGAPGGLPAGDQAAQNGASAQGDAAGTPEASGAQASPASYQGGQG